MPFVKRDADGKIAAVTLQATEEGPEEVPPNDPELGVFLQNTLIDAVAQRHWVESDLGLARVMEDLVDLLIEKNVFRFYDLPEAAQQKLIQRRGLRREFAYVETLFGDGDDNEFVEAADGDGEDEGYL
ncbi:MAG: hypothetical protein QGI06_00445 [Rhodospirillales bacterium]|jgi:hypothetical protein|nr:hypothetical protein [Rhodospirillales bacterium]|tara:strand:+ start:228 stop:611 length:384 start_codon:yes stop_codon:yes gene_type:complete